MVGRPSGELLDPDFPGPFGQEIVEIDARARVLLSPRLLNDVAWLAKGEAGIGLAVLERPGLVRILSFEQHGLNVLERRRRLIDRVNIDPAAAEALAVLEDRYHRMRIPADRRISLSSLLIAHLGVEPGAAIVYVERSLQEIQLLSTATRERRLIAAQILLAELP